ncbi:MAG: hypothetical protein IPP71_23875 [Bacteroidetes bacterium]|nr:hypothetical protein [Bacteroidota bacterium]
MIILHCLESQVANNQFDWFYNTGDTSTTQIPKLEQQSSSNIRYRFRMWFRLQPMTRIGIFAMLPLLKINIGIHLSMKMNSFIKQKYLFEQIYADTSL